MEILITLVISVMANVIAYYICKWLDGRKLFSVTNLG